MCIIIVKHYKGGVQLVQAGARLLEDGDHVDREHGGAGAAVQDVQRHGQGQRSPEGPTRRHAELGRNLLHDGVPALAATLLHQLPHLLLRLLVVPQPGQRLLCSLQ